MGQQAVAFGPILLYLLAIVALVVIILILAHVIGPKRKSPVKQMPYESGMDPIGDARQHFDIKFYLVAILFLVFDLELLFLYPWAVSAYSQRAGVPDIPASLSVSVFGVMLVFLATLTIGFVYAWKKGVFRWR